MTGKVQFYSKIFVNESSRMYFLLNFFGGKSLGADTRHSEKKNQVQQLIFP